MASLFSKRSFLVTGGAGFIGSHIAERLCALGATVTVLDDFSTGGMQKLPFRNERLKVVQEDVRSFDFD